MPLFTPESTEAMRNSIGFLKARQQDQQKISYPINAKPQPTLTIPTSKPALNSEIGIIAMKDRTALLQNNKQVVNSLPVRKAHDAIMNSNNAPADPSGPTIPKSEVLTIQSKPCCGVCTITKQPCPIPFKYCKCANICTECRVQQLEGQIKARDLTCAVCKEKVIFKDMSDMKKKGIITEQLFETFQNINRAQSLFGK